MKFNAKLFDLLDQFHLIIIWGMLMLKSTKHYTRLVQEGVTHTDITIIVPIRNSFYSYIKQQLGEASSGFFLWVVVIVGELSVHYPP